MNAIIILQKLNILKFISIDLNNSVGITQNGHHSMMYLNIFRSIKLCSGEELWFEDKACRTISWHRKAKDERRFDKVKNDYTFYGHEVVGARMVKKILENLKFKKRNYRRSLKFSKMAYVFSDTEQITLSSVQKTYCKYRKRKYLGFNKFKDLWQGRIWS